MKAEFKLSKSAKAPEENPLWELTMNNAITKVNMNEITHKDISAPEELSSEEMSALTGGAGFRYEPPDPC